MQLIVSPENPLEWIALKTNMVPLPLLHAQIFPVVSKAVLEAADAGVFEAVEKGSDTAEAIATTCQLNPKAVRELLGLLTALGYFTFKGGKFKPTAMARKWMTKANSDSVYGMMIFNNRVMWDWMNHLGTYLRTGEGIQYHDNLTTEQWGYYQRAMLAATSTEAREFGRRAYVPKKATKMLDIGGAHGQHSVALCRRMPDLQSTILDLPQAIEQSAPLLAKLDMGGRVRHQAGNALTDDFGEETYDIVLMSSLAHHFTDEQNRLVTQKVAKALRPGGVFIINEFIRPETGNKPELVGSSTDLYYGLTSAAGNWNITEIYSWYQSAGLKPYKVKNYLSIPGRAMVIAKK
ncbi:class I SAM-dependent methyltransferase [Tellurirhabdus bombi]|uniref:class I SAM-dependent methyltransferase n=1 Tax=Tellurirhabdus bombi TaxID=2907205 RepID=UPI001F2F99C9|nr:class I SAM-dependent methyltransferase [Tellurirhabdus bombi]